MQAGLTPLHLAAIQGAVAVAQLLLNKGAVVDAKDQVCITCVSV
jgi:ankyrin repeat protein